MAIDLHYNEVIAVLHDLFVHIFDGLETRHASDSIVPAGAGGLAGGRASLDPKWRERFRVVCRTGTLFGLLMSSDGKSRRRPKSSPKELEDLGATSVCQLSGESAIAHSRAH